MKCFDCVKILFSIGLIVNACNTVFADLSQDAQRLAADILGPQMLEYRYGDTGWTHDYLRSYLASIGGGTSEIQKEIIADRVLSMPKGR